MMLKNVGLTQGEITAILRALDEDDCDPQCCPICAGAVSAAKKLEPLEADDA